VQALTILPLVVCLVGGYFGLRSLVWRSEGSIAVMVQSGMVASLVVGGALAFIYVVANGLFWRLLMFDWLSIQFGALVGALLYGIYNAISPLTIYSVGVPPLGRALQGGMDGLLIGMVIGALVRIVGARPLYLDRPGIIRYLVLFVGILLVAWAVLLVEGAARIPDIFGIVLAFPLLFVLKIVVRRLDRNVGHGEHWVEDYGYDEQG
jgi:hypothetical protein